MRKHNQIHTLGAPHYKEHFDFWESWRILSVPHGPKNLVVSPDVFAGNHLLTTHAKTYERMLQHRALYGDNCGVVWVLRTTWCSRMAAYPKEDYREFALINQRRSSNLGIQNCKMHWSIASLQRICGFMLKS